MGRAEDQEVEEEQTAIVKTRPRPSPPHLLDQRDLRPTEIRGAIGGLAEREEGARGGGGECLFLRFVRARYDF